MTVTHAVISGIIMSNNNAVGFDSIASSSRPLPLSTSIEKLGRLKMYIV